MRPINLKYAIEILITFSGFAKVINMTTALKHHYFNP